MNFNKRFETLLDDLGQQFAVTEQEGRFRVRTPYLYPDGEVIDIFCKPAANGDDLIVTDFAETTNWLSMHSLSQRRSHKQAYLIQDTCVTHGVEFHREMLLARCRPKIRWLKQLQRSLMHLYESQIFGSLSEQELFLRFLTKLLIS